MAKKPKPADKDKETAAQSIPKVAFRKRDWNFTPKQTEILKVMMAEDTKVVFLNGPAGTAKTIVAVYAALCALGRGSAEQVVYIRTVIESASRSLGFLPGLAEDKFLPFLMPLLDKCEELLNPESTKSLTAAQKLIGMPVNFLRGASWRNTIAIFDEAENGTIKELTTVMTRIGKGSKLFIIGDTRQADIGGRSGFVDFLRVFSSPECEEKGIYSFEFTKEDIMRSEILKFIVEKIEEIDQGKTYERPVEEEKKSGWVPRL